MAYWQDYENLKEKGLIVSIETVHDGSGDDSSQAWLVKTTYATFNPQTGERTEDRYDTIPLSEAEKVRADLQKQWSDINVWMNDALATIPPTPPVVEGIPIEGEPLPLEPAPPEIDMGAGTIEEASGVEAVPIVPAIEA